MNEQIITDYITATEALCDAFYKKYYWSKEDGEYEKSVDDLYVIWGYRDMWPDIVWIGDQSWDISDIYTAIKNDIDQDILWKWYDQHQDLVSKQEQFINLWTFWLKEIWKPMYSKEEIETSEKSAEKANKLFQDEISKYQKSHNIWMKNI